MSHKGFWIYGTLLFALVAAVSLVPRILSESLGGTSSDLVERTEPQRANIRQGAQALDGLTLKPGEECSFNQRVGPRTLERGYRPAPAFLEAEVTESIGGGICQLSSTLYAAVLDAGFPVLQRVPHRYRIHSVPPGRDATVWYGKADLRWKNDLPLPVRVECKVRGERLFIRLLGHSHRKVRVQTRPIPSSRPGTCRYETRRWLDGQETLWFDSYRESFSTTPP